MKAIPFPQANKVLKAPPSERSEILAAIEGAEAAGVDVSGMREKLDAAFPPEQEVWGGEVEDVPRCISCWEPSPEERARIAAGGLVWLWVVGTTHPPLVLDAAHPFDQKEPEASPVGGPPRGNVLARFPAQRDDIHDIAEEYAIVAIDTPPGVMLWGRVENRWFANPSGREVIRQLLARLAAPQALTLTPEEERTVHSARIGASHEVDTLLAIIDRLTGKRIEGAGRMLPMDRKKARPGVG